MLDVVDLFSGGAGGWCRAANDLGLDALGFENDYASLQSRIKAELTTVEGDVRLADPRVYVARGLTGSPPCQTFSGAGNGDGMWEVQQMISAGSTANIDTRTVLVLEPLRWAILQHRAGTPYEWILLEQVREALPVWELMRPSLTRAGYHVHTGIIAAEQYGVPQTRRRAILMASLRKPVRFPTPTHSRYHNGSPTRRDPGVPSWISMSEALLPETDTVLGVMTGTSNWYQQSNYSAPMAFPGQTAQERGLGRRDLWQPSFTITSKLFKWVHKQSGMKSTVSIRDMATLQSFPRNIQLMGGMIEQRLQIGNAIPPLLAQALLQEICS